MAVFNPIRFSRGFISDVQPFTYRDSFTVLDKLESLFEAINTNFSKILALTDELTDVVKAVNNRFEQMEADYNNKIDALTKKHDYELLALEKKLTALIIASNEEGTCFNPTNGSRYESLSKVISDVYDNLRLYSYFAREFDDGTTTAGEFDNSGGSARHHDLYPNTLINEELKN